MPNLSNKSLSNVALTIYVETLSNQVSRNLWIWPTPSISQLSSFSSTVYLDKTWNVVESMSLHQKAQAWLGFNTHFSHCIHLHSTYNTSLSHGLKISTQKKRTKNT